MKFALFALLAAFCVLSVSAGTLPLDRPDNELIYEPSDLDGEFVTPELYFDPVEVVVWALRGVKSINCFIKWAVGIGANALQFNRQVLLCGKSGALQVDQIVDANVQIIKTVNDIVHMKSNICASKDDSTDPKVNPLCVMEAMGQALSLVGQVKNVINMATKIPQNGPKAVRCLSRASKTLTTYYTSFPKDMLQCSHLTSH